MKKSLLATCSLIAVAFTVSFLLTSDVSLSLCVTAVTLCFQLSLFWILSQSDTAQIPKG
ncbi:hypothetical protein [Alteromonas antoniana]|uniref:hypothetical protein n=1 Tax=Alteromonas antoniana TaxID=2803813 RepID=UPI001C464D3F|nr:hypothetical protein [Alteromonas antoniana]